MSLNMDAKSQPPVSQECEAHGRKLRASRVAAGKTLCDVTDARSVDLVNASAIERGQMYNLHIKPEEWADIPQVAGIGSANIEISRWPTWKRIMLFEAFGVVEAADK